MVVAQQATTDPHELLPSDLVRLVFLLLPAEARLRCREVCRGWRAFLADASLWRVCRADSLAVLKRCSLRACGTLRVLQLELDSSSNCDVPRLLAVVRANAASLRELQLGPRPLSAAAVQEVLDAAPGLSAFEADIEDSAAAAAGLLERAAAGPLRVRRVCLDLPFDTPGGAFGAAAAAHPSLSALLLRRGGWAASSLAAFLPARLSSLELADCPVSPALLPALTALLGGPVCALRVTGRGQSTLCAGAALPPFCAALARAPALDSLTLSTVLLFDSLPDGLAVLAACNASVTLRALCVAHNEPDTAAAEAAAGAALRPLTARLRCLDVAHCGLGDAGLRPLVEGLGASRTLERLDVVRCSTRRPVYCTCLTLGRRTLFPCRAGTTGAGPAASCATPSCPPRSPAPRCAAWASATACCRRCWPRASWPPPEARRRRLLSSLAHSARFQK